MGGLGDDMRSCEGEKRDYMIKIDDGDGLEKS